MACTAAYGSTAPAPASNTLTSPGRAVAVFISAVLMASGLSPWSCWTISAAVPATYGAAIEVPLRRAYA